MQVLFSRTETTLKCSIFKKGRNRGADVNRMRTSADYKTPLKPLVNFFVNSFEMKIERRSQS
jgi:hypothetical protein